MGTQALSRIRSGNGSDAGAQKLLIGSVRRQFRRIVSACPRTYVGNLGVSAQNRRGSFGASSKGASKIAGKFTW